MIKFFRKIGTTDKDLSQVQDNVQQTFNTLYNIKLLDGILVQSLAVTTSPVKYPHPLQRVPTGFFVTNANVPVYLGTSGSTTTTITLTASTAATVDIWIF